VWNAVIGYAPQLFDGIVCPRCFAELAEAKGAKGPWRVAPREWPDGVSLVHVDGRVWDATAELWADARYWEAVQPNAAELADAAAWLKAKRADTAAQAPSVEALTAEVARLRGDLHESQQAANVLRAKVDRQAWSLRRAAEHRRQGDEARTERDALAARLDRLRAGIEGLADQIERAGITCACGHYVGGEHNGNGCYAVVTYTPLVRCSCTLTDGQDEDAIVADRLRALLAEDEGGAGE
jgi:hypothetical protein